MILVLKEWKKRDELGNKVETVKIIKGNFEYIDGIITKEQINNLKRYGNTNMDSLVYEKVGYKDTIAELKRLTGLNCDIRISRGTVLIETEERRIKYAREN